MVKIGIIGGGNMGLAILSRIAKTDKVCVCEKDVKRAAFLKKKYKVCVCELSCVASWAEVIILAVKPQDMDSVLAEIKPKIRTNALIISIAAGITTAYLEKRLGKGVKVIRTMPNMPAQIGEGITAIAKGKFASKADISRAVKIFKSIGETVVVKENLMDAVTAVSGSGPAYVFLFAECFWQAARKLGLDCELTCKLIGATINGSVKQMLSAKEGPMDLRAKVTSKGGTTQAAIEVFEKACIRDTFVKALAAAKKRAGELAR